MNSENDWLLNAEVKCLIEHKNGRWEVSLLFINSDNPIQLLKRKINDYPTEKLATIAANYMKQSAEKGRKQTNKNAFNINFN